MNAAPPRSTRFACAAVALVSFTTYAWLTPSASGMGDASEFTLVLATILRSRGAVTDAQFGGLLLYAALNTLLPSFVLRAPFDVAPPPRSVPSPGDERTL